MIALDGIKLGKDLAGGINDGEDHIGITKTFAAVQKWFFWPRMQNDIINIVNKCDLCQRYRPSLEKDNEIVMGASLGETQFAATGWHPPLSFSSSSICAVLDPSWSKHLPPLLTRVLHTKRRSHATLVIVSVVI